MTPLPVSPGVTDFMAIAEQFLRDNEPTTETLATFGAVCYLTGVEAGERHVGSQVVANLTAVAERLDQFRAESEG